MGLSARQLGELVQECLPLVRGALVREVQPLPPRDLLLVLAPPDPAAGAVLRLRFSAAGEHARVHLQVAPVKRHAGPADPFFARVAEALAGCTLHGLEQVQEDRVVRASFRRDGQPSAELVGELTGAHANLVLLDRAGAVQAALVPPARGTAAAARLAGGTAYALPPGKKGPSSPGPSIAEGYPAPEEHWPLAERAPLSARVDLALGAAARSRLDEERRAELLRRLERRAAAAAGLVAGLEQRERTCAQAERVRMDAELLLAHLAAPEGSLARGASSVELPDSFQPGSPLRKIELDPGLAPRRNAERLFARYKKLKRTLERLPEELALARATQERLAALLERARGEDPGALEAEAIAAGLLTPPQERVRKARKPSARLPYLAFRGLRGSEIRVGRTAADNDRLTFREARGNDVWLHTADAPGSHVVLRLASEEPDDEEVLDAAHLAVHFSPLRGASRADVHVARRKQVHKPRRAPPGLVTLSGGKVLRLRLEPGRLERLLGGRARGGADAGEGRSRGRTSG